MALSIAEMAQMSSLLDEAMPLDLADRRRWIERLSPQHRPLAPVLRESLLREAGRGCTTPGLDTLPKIDTGATGQVPAASRLKCGEQVGPYRLVRQLGSGGMAEVWLARRSDEGIEREVALKLPMRTRDRGDLVPRFVHECAILAELEHAHIVRLYDTGVLPDGLPYLAMEYVQGEALTRWCAIRGLAPRARIELFLQVLDAVHYAHARRVIHRDLKPSNVLVTPDGQVRLLDFGVAKVLPGGPARDEELTQQYGRALTPDYASPESFRGAPAGAASDVYSLGVMLYELLTGRRPYRIGTGARPTQLRRDIATACVERPAAPLRAGPPHAIALQSLPQSLRGSLGGIVLKALAIAPERRYRSAAELAEDLRRILRGTPVVTRTDPRADRAVRRLLRFWAGVAAAISQRLSGLADFLEGEQDLERPIR